MHIYSKCFMLVVYSLMFISSTFAFIYGVKNFFKKKVALFAQIVVCAMGCFALSHLFELIQIYIIGGIPMGFHIGNLGLIGGMAFLLSASYGQMDGLVDDHSKRVRRYRYIAYIVPCAMILVLIPLVLADIELEEKILGIVKYIFIAMAAYYNFKHVIIPDEELGLIRVIRKYNICAVLLEVLTLVLVISLNLNNEIIIGICAVLLSSTYVSIILILKRGVSRWTI